MKIEIYRFQNELRDETYDNGELEFTTRTLLKRLKSQYLAAADRILQDIGMEEYRRRWRYDFPIEEYDKIKNSKQTAERALRTDGPSAGSLCSEENEETEDKEAVANAASAAASSGRLRHASDDEIKFFEEFMVNFDILDDDQ